MVSKKILLVSIGLALASVVAALQAHAFEVKQIDATEIALGIEPSAAVDVAAAEAFVIRNFESEFFSVVVLKQLPGDNATLVDKAVLASNANAKSLENISASQLSQRRTSRPNNNGKSLTKTALATTG